MPRPNCIKHWKEIQTADDRHYRGSQELLSIGSPFGRHFGFARLGIHHELLPAGRRTSWPHCESTEDEYIYVIEGMPDVWLDGNLVRLAPGDGVGFPAGTGLSHTFINNTDSDVRLLVVGDRDRDDNQLHYPLHPARKEQLGERHWTNWRERPMGSHDGLPDRLLSAGGPLNKAHSGEATTMTRPDCIKHWKEIQQADNATYPDSRELLSIGSPFGRHFGFARLGIHHELLPPGRRTSWPHCEETEDEFIYVIEGTPDVWLDGNLVRLAPGDGVGFPAGTGLSHAFINNTDSNVRLLVVGDRNRDDNRFHYPLHPARNAQIGAHHWNDLAPRPLGLHDGLPDQLRKAGGPF